MLWFKMDYFRNKFIIGGKETNKDLVPKSEKIGEI